MFVRGIFLFDITFNKTFLLKVCMGKRKKKQQQQQTNNECLHTTTFSESNYSNRFCFV